MTESLDPFLRQPVRAADYFRVRYRAEILPGGVGTVRLFLQLLIWLIPRLQSGLPAYSYLAVTTTELHILEISHRGPSSVRRHVGTWELPELHAQRLNRWGAKLDLGSRQVELEAVKFTKRSAAVIDLLVSASGELTELAT